VTHRLWVARGSTSITFTARAFDLVHALSGGVPRVINLICDRSLMVARQKEVSRITEEHVVQAAGNLNLPVPRHKIRGERDEGEPAPQPRRRLVTAAIVIALVALAGAGIAATVGNPLELLEPAIQPAEPRVEARWLPAPVAPLTAPAATAVTAAPPPMPGSFSILIGTYDSARQVELVERSLRAQQHPVYMVDVLMGPGDVQRRVLLGRYPTLDEAEKVRASLGPVLNSARVIRGELERLRVIP
jgi:hypothetical protein